MDKEYIVLDCINGDQQISQRQLAAKTGLSLGSVNLLLKKMIREGLIKVENIPANRVLYMLTPKGMVEKANKSYQYIKFHYDYIHQMKEKIKEVLMQLATENQRILVLIDQDEISDLVITAINEIRMGNIQLINTNDLNKTLDDDLVIVLRELDSGYHNSPKNYVNLIERL